MSSECSMQNCQYVIQGFPCISSVVQVIFIPLVEDFEQLRTHFVAIQYLNLLVVALKLIGALVEIP